MQTMLAYVDSICPCLYQALHKESTTSQPKSATDHDLSTLYQVSIIYKGSIDEAKSIVNEF